MGHVYRARDPRLERDIALKILRIDPAAGPKAEARLLREARAAASLSHPNVVGVHDVGEVKERGLAYIAMELVVGRTLRAYVGDESIAIDRRIAWLLDAARALGAAHAAGIVHRDVKPENIMIRADGVVKVLDFGIARRDIESSADPYSPGSTTAGRSVGPITTAQGIVVGTPLYMAPEQLRGEVLDARTDQFAWAVVAYELLTGVVPWRSETPIGLAASILNITPLAPRERNAAISLSVSTILMKALAKRRDGRFGTMLDVVAAVGDNPSSASLGAKEPIKVPTERSPATERLPPRRPPFVRALVGLSAIGVAGCISIGVAHVLNARRHRVETSSPKTMEDACVTNLECVERHQGAPWHVATVLGTPAFRSPQPICEVDVAPSALRREDTVWFGGIFPMKPEDGWASEARGARLAHGEIWGSR